MWIVSTKLIALRSFVSFGLLEEMLQIPLVMHCNQRSVFSGTEGLCMLLRRLAYPCRYSDLIQRFARPVPVISMITNTVLDHIY